MKPKVYVETTIVSYLAAHPSRDLVTAAHQQITRDWWNARRDAFDLYAAQSVLKEAAAGDPVVAHKRLELLEDIPILPLTGEIMDLANDFVLSGALPAKAAVDALHIATATVYACDYLLTWNCRHIANAEIIRLLRTVAVRHGFELPLLCTPEELMGENYDGEG
jgi:hypothetical protein